jgi:hypothetical protein
MRRHEKLLAELAAALRAKSEAKQVWADRRADALEARGVYNEKVALVEEIQEEIETGSSGRPLLDEIAAREGSAVPPPPPEPPAPPPEPPRPAAKKKAKAKAKAKGPQLAGVEFPTATAIMAELTEADAQERFEPPPPAAPEAANGVAPSYREQLPGSTSSPQAGEKPFWESADLDLELMHAVFYGNQDWVDYKRSGATNEQILERLASRWPVFRLSVDFQDSGGNFGYTIACPGGEPAIWVGPYLGSHHKPSATGAGLADRVRRLLGLPTPAMREPTISANGPAVSLNGTVPALPPEPSAEDKKPIRPSTGSRRDRQSGRGPR